MQENRNARCFSGNESSGTVCISTKRVLDSCKDRDCFEDVRVYLSAEGESILANSSNVRTKCAHIVSAYVGVDEVPFNRGFYQVTVRYYIKVELESCLGIGRNQSFSGIAVLEKDVILYGGEGGAVSYSSENSQSYCDMSGNIGQTNSPTAVVEAIEPIVLSTKVKECGQCCTCECACCDIPDAVSNCIGGNVVYSSNTNLPRLYVSFGVFSVIRIERDAQLLIQATDYSVPDKECVAATSDNNPCALFSTMPFPIGQFKTVATNHIEQEQNSGGCGCKNKNIN